MAHKEHFLFKVLRMVILKRKTGNDEKVSVVVSSPCPPTLVFSFGPALHIKAWRGKQWAAVPVCLKLGGGEWLKELIADTRFNSWGPVEHMYRMQPMTMRQSFHSLNSKAAQQPISTLLTEASCMTGFPLEWKCLLRLQLHRDPSTRCQETSPKPIVGFRLC